MTTAPVGGAIRLVELLGALSYAADLGLGQPMQHCLRQTVIAGRLASLTGSSDRDRDATFYLGLLMNAHCHADATEQARWFADDIGFKAAGIELLDMNTAQSVGFMLRRLTSHGSAVQRGKRLLTFPLAGHQLMLSFMATHSALGAVFADRIGLEQHVCTAMGQAYEQWDGTGVPSGLSGGEISLAVRLVQLAGPVEVISRRRGTQAAISMVRRNRGTEFDPELADLFCAHAGEVLDSIDDAATWDAVLADEPQPSRRVDGAELDGVLAAMADLADLKSPFLAGHSRGVANLADEAAAVSGMSETDRTTVRRAALIHDLGRVGVSTAIWDKPSRLTGIEMDRVRLHPYLTDRMLAPVTALGAARTVAARHHERLDGSGYPHGLTAMSLTPLDRLLAAADVYHAMCEPRPHRAALESAAAARQLRAEVRSGRLDADAVDAVLRAAGHRAPARRSWPAGLTAREVEVLQLVARGRSNKQIAATLRVTPKTVSNHVEHVYTKIGVSSRAAATLYATRQGLLGTFETG